MKIATSPFLSVCCEKEYQEHIEKAQNGALVMLYKCAACKKECRISAASADYVSECHGVDIEHPTEEVQLRNGQTKIQAIMPKTCGYCKEPQNFCTCELGNYYLCSQCGKKTAIVPQEKKDRFVKPRKGKNDKES